MTQQVLVVGGGAAGLSAAIAAARGGASVTVIEHARRMGQKILATGNGKCNLGNTAMNADCYHSSHPEFVKEVLKQWGTADTMDFFQSLNIHIKIRDGYLYPWSGQASAVRDVLLMEAAYRKVKLKTNCAVSGIQREKGMWTVQMDNWKYRGDSLILSTGSPASNIEGADDSGYRLVRSLGHDVIRPLPALVPLVCLGVNTRKWAGIRIEGKAELLIDGKSVAEYTGELQLTDYGISGIPVFQLSAQAVRAFNNRQKVQLRVDFMPSLDEAAFRRLMQQRKAACPYKTEKELFVGLLPDKLIAMLPDAEALNWIKKLTLTVNGSKNLSYAQVCSGGVDVSQIDSWTMQSRLHPKLYFAGEIMDVDGICGGYNLHWAWATGNLAGRACIAGEKK